MERSILIIDDNEEILLALELFLRKHFDIIDTLNSPVNIHTRMENRNFDVVILDMNFRSGDNSGNEGLFWLRELLKKDPEIVIICITAYGDVKLAVKAMQEGAFDFIEKPWDEDKLLATIMRARKMSQSKKKLRDLKQHSNRLNKLSTGSERLVKGRSALMQGIWHSVEKIAPTDANVLISGENGTGKELLARYIHQYSKRNEAPFVPVDLGSLNPGLFESELFGHVKGAFTSAYENRTGWFEIAQEGTLFLDEIANMGVEQQAKLLTVLQNRELSPVGSTHKTKLDVRIISASNANLRNLISKGLFREDLLYRLNTIEIHLPALRDRSDDIPELVVFYLENFKSKYQKPHLQASDHLISQLKKYPWPGNIRELKHWIERMVILSDGNKLEIPDMYEHQISDSVRSSHDKDDLKLSNQEKRLILQAIKKSKGNYSNAAKMLGISRRTLYNKLSKYEI